MQPTPAQGRHGVARPATREATVASGVVHGEPAPPLRTRMERTPHVRRPRARPVSRTRRVLTSRCRPPIGEERGSHHCYPARCSAPGTGRTPNDTGTRTKGRRGGGDGRCKASSGAGTPASVRTRRRCGTSGWRWCSTVGSWRRARRWSRRREGTAAGKVRHELRSNTGPDGAGTGSGALPGFRARPAGHGRGGAGAGGAVKALSAREAAEVVTGDATITVSSLYGAGRGARS